MSSENADTIPYKRANFTTQLPVAYRYTPAHFWLAQEEEGLLRVGFTKFATRMLGEMVDHQFDAVPGTPVAPGHHADLARSLWCGMAIPRAGHAPGGVR